MLGQERLRCVEMQALLDFVIERKLFELFLNSTTGDAIHHTRDVLVWWKFGGNLLVAGSGLKLIATWASPCTGDGQARISLFI